MFDFSFLPTARLIFSEKPNAFLILFEAISQKMPQKVSSTTGFIRYFHRLFLTLQNVVLLKVFDVSQVVKRIQLLLKNLMLFDTF